MKTAEKKDSKIAARERVRKHRAAMRAMGMKPVQIWVPDTTRPGFAEEVRRQCLAIRGDPHEREILDWIEQVQDTRGWI